MLSAMSKNKETWKTDMIKTLRITSIIAVVLAVVFFVLPSAFGVRGDEQIEQFLNSAGVIEKFKETRGDKVKDSRQGISPLVKQAEAFAFYLNPPPKPEIKSLVSHSKPRPKASVSPKFKLIGTSRYELRPELSLALIDEPGKGLRWVRQFSKVGYLIIEQVKDGLVVVRDDKSTFEVVAERPKKRSLLKGDSSFGARITSGRLAERGAEVQISAEEAALMGEAAAREEALSELDAFLRRLKQEEAQPDVELGETYSGPDAEEMAAERQRLISELENIRISELEAKKLGRLGRRLKDVQRGQNRVEDDRTESDANLIKSNLGDLDLNDLDLNELDLNDVNIPG